MTSETLARVQFTGVLGERQVGLLTDQGEEITDPNYRRRDCRFSEPALVDGRWTVKNLTRVTFGPFAEASPQTIAYLGFYLPSGELVASMPTDPFPKLAQLEVFFDAGAMGLVSE